MMRAYDQVSLWVATEILTQDKARRRVMFIKKFIDIAKVIPLCSLFSVLLLTITDSAFAPAQQLPHHVRCAGWP